MATKETGASLRPSDMSAGGALIDDADVTIQAASFELYDFNGKAAMKSCAKLTLVTDDNEEHVEYLSAADPKHFTPSSDNTRLVAVGDKTSLNNSSKWALFIISLINAGFDEGQIGDSIEFLNGQRVHIKRKAAPKSWSSMANRTSDREATVLEVTAILDAPAKGKGKGAAAKGATAAKPAAGKAAAKSANLDEELYPLVIQAVTDAGGKLEKKGLVPAIFRLATGENKKAMVKRVFEDEFLEAGMGEGHWVYDGETVELS